MPLYKVIVEKHQDGYVAYPLGLSYALPISMGGLIESPLMTNLAYDTSSRRCSPREIVITVKSKTCCKIDSRRRG